MEYPLIQRFLNVLVALLTLSLALDAYGRGFGELGLHLSSERTHDETAAGSTATSTRYFRADIATGWLSSLDGNQSLSYGVILKSERGFQSSSEISGYGLGTFMGWYRGPLSVRLDYLVLAELKANNGITETQYRLGSGFVLEARWLQWFQVGADFAESKFAIGPAIAFARMTYSATRVGSLPETSATRITESLTPGLRGVFIF